MDKRISISMTVFLQLAVVLLAIRIVFRIFGASAATPLFSSIYGISTWLLTPFLGLIQNPVFNNSYVFDLVGVIGLLVYGMFLYLFSSIVEKGKRGDNGEDNIIEGEIVRETTPHVIH